MPMSGYSSIPEVEVVASTRRRWTEAEKRAILDEAAQKARAVSDRIEIVLACGHRLIVGKDVDVSALWRIVDVLERRPVSRSPQGEG